MKYYVTQSGFCSRNQAEIDEAMRAQLSSYIQDGIVSDAREGRPSPDVTPPFRNWERMLPNDLGLYANLALTELELKVSGGADYDPKLAATAFAGAYTGNMIEYYAHSVFPQRFPGRHLNMISLKDVPFTALGVVIGAFDEAFRLAGVQMSSYRKKHYFDLDHYPAFVFILRLLADYLGEGQLSLIGESAEEPIFRMLFDKWREPPPGAIEELCLAACDFHTHRCAPAKRDVYHEFAAGGFMLTPIEILLLFKLRHLLGLENPVLDHPMMATPLGRLPPEVGFRPDDLIAKVRLRMQQDGFDERAISSL